MCRLTVLEARSPGSRCQQGEGEPVPGPSPGFWWPQVLLGVQVDVFTHLPSVCVYLCVPISPFYKDTGHIG